MFKKPRKAISCLLIITMLFLSTGTVFAYDSSEFENEYQKYTEEEQRRIKEIIQSSDNQNKIGIIKENFPLSNDGTSTYTICLNCDMPFSVVTVCAAEATLAEEGYHNTFLGIPTGCYMYYFVSRAAEICMYCQKVVRQIDVQHGCWEVHKKCGKGEYDICPMDVT